MDKPVATTDPKDVAGTGALTATIALAGFVLIATASTTNMILARGLAGSVPPFTLAFVRWTIIAAGLAPFAIAEVRSGRLPFRSNALPILATGFLGMFLCGAPVYIAGTTTSAINIALIMSLSPIVVLLLSRLLGLEHIHVPQLLGMALALIGALVIVTRGDLHTLLGLHFAQGDLLMLMPMLGWSGYTLMQSRVAASASFLARVSLFAAAGALLTMPIALFEISGAPQLAFTPRAFAAYLFAGLVPGLLAYTGFAYLAGRFGSVRASMSIYIGPIAGALLSWMILGEPPSLLHVAGGLFILGGVWLSLRK
jgi:drug/metabolite transporter (DMT)-like permease